MTHSHNIKEEILSTHLDARLSCNLFSQLDFDVLYRILSSPERIINNHSQLFRFVMNLFNRKNEKKEENNTFAFASVLDYERMKEEEILELLSHSLFNPDYQPSHSEILINKLIILNKTQNKSSQAQINELYLKIAEQQASSVKMIQELQTMNDELIKSNQDLQQQLFRQINEHKQIITILESTILTNVNQKIEDNQEKLKKSYSTKFENIEKTIGDQNIQLTNVNSKINNSMIELSKEIKNYSQNQNNKINDNHDKIMKQFDELQNKVKEVSSRVLLKLSYSPSFPLDGIITHLRSFQGKVPYLHGVSIEGISSNVLDKNNAEYSMSKNEPNSSFCIVFHEPHQISLSSYTIRTSNFDNPYYIRSWIVEGSNDQKTWKELDKHQNDLVLKTRLQIVNFPVHESEPKGYFRFIRLRTTGLNSHNSNEIDICNIELFGKYF
ncbi:hypothetical protein TRFO_29699 [Tritrichomonas foetus]|uniref:F5/8 type C domain-containing protein n=1 Tax=Tritrichomonas foetus TaxID=1144522 RepID=A0A1J4JV12_9EUKA|nr:hypothetical protein TRFO_29699 [Tritrichomonas foetus]|eukprot:OHT02999.1 hypothetical protein TRFO_29699 [Tritrichomonas foetus]